MQIIGWKDKRFDLSRALARFVLSPRDNMLSTPWPQPIEQSPVAEAFLCCRLDDLANDLMAASAAIWERVLAYLVLSRKERDVWLDIKGPQKRRHEWLRGRLAAKDAVRLYLKKHYGIEQLPADIEITSDENGRPIAGGSWTKQIESGVLLSLAHSGRIAV